MEKYHFEARDALGNVYAFKESKTEHGLLLTLKKEDIKAISNIKALGDFTEARVGDEGFYVFPRTITQSGDILVRFEQRADCAHRQERQIMSFVGIKRDDVCCLVRIKRNYQYATVVTVKDGAYRMEIEFDLESDYADPKTGAAPEDIELELVFLDEDADYNDMARMERKIRLARGEIRPLAEKCRREAVEYARRYPLIRIRLGWKPCPSPIKHQTVELEPPMHVACTFAKVREIADECRRQGIEGADLQLVGWNISGHDGRLPQLFPVEAALGGEDEMRATMAYVKSLGYRVSTHTNMQDGTEIADNFTWNDMAFDTTGNSVLSGHYSGGYCYYVCPECQLANMRRDYPRVKALGENGTHFTDVASIIPPRPCHNPRHPMSYADSLSHVLKNLDEQCELFGSISSEGCCDYAIDHIDYGLYITMGDGFGHRPTPVTSEFVHLWEVAYHGTMLYNQSSATVNATAKSPKERLMVVLHGARPTYYFYSKFCTGSANWMGDIDLTCEELERSVGYIKQGLADYEPLRELQFVYMDRYDILGDGVEMATYENGTRIVGNFSDEVKTFEQHEIEPYGYRVL